MAEGTGAAIYGLEAPAAKPDPGEFLALFNDSGRDRLVGTCVLRVLTPSGAAATIDVGIASARDTAAEDVINNASIAETGLVDMFTGSPAAKVWPAGQYLTVSKATGIAEAEVGVVAHLILRWITDAVNSEGLPSQ